MLGAEQEMKERAKRLSYSVARLLCAVPSRDAQSPVSWLCIFPSFFFSFVCFCLFYSLTKRQEQPFQHAALTAIAVVLVGRLQNIEPAEKKQKKKKKKTS